MHWKIKAYTQKLLSAVPFGSAINDLLQRTAGGLRDFEKNLEVKVNDWSSFAAWMREVGVSPAGLHYLEIGTGWFPTLPLCWSLAGASSVVTFDLTRHLNRKLTWRLLHGLASRLPFIARAAGRDLPAVESAYRTLRQARTLPELFALARLDYRAPADATQTALPDESVDIVFSNSVLEHVPGDVIRELMRESVRLLRRGGLAVHAVNCGDHYAYFDRRITPLHYLTFSEPEWRFWNNRLLFQNRLRPRDFLQMAESAGLTIELAKCKPRPDLLAVLPSLKIAPEFQQYPPEQLCSTSLGFVGRKP